MTATATITLDSKIAGVLVAAKTAADVKALELWERDGKEDRGSCGSACMQLKLNTKLAKEAIGRAFASKDGFVTIDLPEGIRTQNADIYQGWMRAFREVLVANGYESAIKRFWTYID